MGFLEIRNNKLIQKIILIFIVILFVNCKDESEYKRIKYYKSGNIEEMRIYQNEHEFDLNKNYRLFTYNEDGTLNEIIDYEDNEINGNYFKYKNENKLYAKYSVQDGEKHGVAKHFDKNGNTTIKILAINDKELIWEKLVYFEQYNSFGYLITKNHDFDSTASNIGFYLISNSYTEFDSIGNYYKLSALTDTISFNQSFSFNIKLLFSNKNISKCQVKIGELNQFGNFIYSNSTNVFNFDSIDNININVKPRNIGKNLLLGKLYITQDTIIGEEKYFKDQEFILFYEYYVRKW